MVQMLAPSSASPHNKISPAPVELVQPGLPVLPVSALAAEALAQLFAAHGLQLAWVAEAAEIPGSYWGDSEAGLIASTLYVRADTPVHSALHEGCHWLLATPERRASLHTNAGGCDTEENAVCYLQCLLAAQLPGYSQARCFADMDAWGYSFIRGSAAAWFAGDSDDAVAFLQQRGWLP